MKKLILGGLFGLSMALNAQNSSCNFNLSLLPGLGTNNAGFGVNTLTLNTTGDFNSVLGNQAIMNNTSGSNNSALGFQALMNNSTGNQNVAIGYQALLAATSNNRNSAVGYGALAGLGAGSGDMNTALGFAADVGVSFPVTNAAAIGANSQVMNSNQMILGDNLVNVGIGLSGNPAGPTAKLEISSGLTGTSGLKFRNLTALTPTITNPGFGVLALDNTGRVVYVGTSGGGGGGSSPGNYCGAPGSPLTGNFEMPLAGNNYNFTMPSSSTSQVLIGYPVCNSGQSKLNVTDDILGTGIKGSCSTTGNNIGVHGLGTDPGPGGSGIITIGMLGETGTLYPGNKSVGVMGIFGGLATGAYGSIPTGGVAIYGNALAYGSLNSYAGYFDGNVTINGSAPVSSSGAGSPPPGPYALHVNGNAMTTAGAWYLSDRRFKKEIRPLQSSLDKIASLTGYNYEFKVDEFKDKQFNRGRQIGFIAQELKEVFPELVSEGKDGYLAVNYQGLIPVLLEGIKELKSQLAEQKQLLENPGQRSSISTGLNSFNPAESGFQMSQNEPNPFTHETVVKYTLPATISSAFMAVYDLTGKQITTLPIHQMGSASLIITSKNLAAGIYIYSIVADGKIVDSKRMIIAE